MAERFLDACIKEHKMTSGMITAKIVCVFFFVMEQSPVTVESIYAYDYDYIDDSETAWVKQQLANFFIQKTNESPSSPWKLHTKNGKNHTKEVSF